MAPALRSIWPTPVTFKLLRQRVEELDALGDALTSGPVALLELCIELVHNHKVGGQPASIYALAFELALAAGGEQPPGEEVKKTYRVSEDHMRQLRELGRVLELTQKRMVELMIEVLVVEGGGPKGRPKSRVEQFQRLDRIIYSSDPLDGNREAARSAEHGALSLPP